MLPISFPFDKPPEQAAAVSVAPGILWLRLPLPLRLNHVNVWALEEDHGWSVVDCGANTAISRDIWEALFTGPLVGRPIRRLIATHGHLDHVGLAGWFAERCDVPFVATLAEWQGAQLRYLQRQHAPAGMQAYLARHGCDQQTIAQFLSARLETMSLLGPQPPSLLRIREGDAIRFGRRSWRVIVAGGHADEHASFYCEEERILIVGDQVLPRITPVIGVFPGEPEADPLGEYLRSLDRFEALPADCLVLPSHGTPFTGLHTRLAALRRHHRERLDTVLGLLEAPSTAWTMAGRLFPRAVAEGHGRLALAETLAHLHRLAADSSVVVRVGEGGELRFARGG